MKVIENLVIEVKKKSGTHRHKVLFFADYVSATGKTMYDLYSKTVFEIEGAYKQKYLVCMEEPETSGGILKDGIIGIVVDKKSILCKTIAEYSKQTKIHRNVLINQLNTGKIKGIKYLRPSGKTTLFVALNQ